MSHDIGELRALCGRLDEVRRQEAAMTRDLAAAEVAALAAAFGPDPDAHPHRVQNCRGWGVDGLTIHVDFRADRRAWLCRVWGYHLKADAWHFADTPRAAVEAALVALTVTHAAEAAALAAVVPKGSP